jgi:hypothetical protein
MYCIAQFEKVKDTRKITAMANHNLRLHLSVADKKKIDPTRTKLNRLLENPLGIDLKRASSMARCFKQHWDRNAIQMKSDSVLLIDLVLTTSPEFWADPWHQNGAMLPSEKAKLDSWLPAQIDFIKKHFGPDALKFAVLHLDEKTPHIHLMLSPEQTKTLKYKNQYGTQEKTVTSLNANRWNPIFWKKFVTAYAKANEKFNLKRPVEDSMTEKIEPREYEKLVKFAMSEDYSGTIEKMVAAVLSELNLYVNTKASVEKAIAAKLTPKLKVLAKSNKALKSLVKLDREQEYKLIKKLQSEAEKQISEAFKKIEYHGNKLKAIQDLEDKIKTKDQIIEAQQLEIKRLSPTPMLLCVDKANKYVRN